jgi:fermentation-respiration switch protein FrsA (DUF1100 family)
MLIFIQIIVVLVAVYSVLGWSLYFMQPALLYKPVRQVLYTPEELDLYYEEVEFITSDGLALSAWFIPAQNAKTTVLFCHGNGGNIMHRLDTINILYELGLNCFIFDYRGYGNSQGTPTEQGTYLDAQAAYHWLTNDKKISPDNIIIFGRSLGGAIAANLAASVRSKALVVESTFTSYVDIGKKFYPYMPVRWFARFGYQTVDSLKKVNCLVMVVHSSTDDLVPFEFGRELYRVANEPKKFVEIYGSHNDGFLVSSEIYKKAWREWLKMLSESGSISGQHYAS